MATDELTDAWFITVHWTGGETIYHLHGADGGTDEGEIRRALVEAEVQLLSDDQAKLDQQQGYQRVTVMIRQGKPDSRWIGSIRSSSLVSTGSHKYYRPDSDYDQTVEALGKVGFVT